ncbi:hypothetical protein [Methanopyrus sp. SNP6]|uniref:hypothetical protein n=1 Tax=Methanopyrus sp. SNP6 TaxID=1937005 RepID=UPI0011E5ACA7|nr:hypothetical protein [Methanopyrus sp. SNP6]
MRALALLVLVLAASVGAAAEEAPLYGVLTHPWTFQLSANQAKQISKEYVISVEAPAGAQLPLGKAYYGVFVADGNHAALIVDLTPAVTGETEDAVVVDPNAISGKLPPAVKFRQWKPAHLARGALLALSLETKPLPIGLSLKMVDPEELTIKVGKFQVKLNRELLKGLARVLATYEYGHPHGKTPVGYLQALVFKYFVKASVTGAEPEELQKLEVSEEEKEGKEEKEVNEETGYALRAFLEVNEQQGLTDLKAEFSVDNLENLIGEAVTVLQDVLSSPEAQQAAATAESAFKKFVQVPVAAVCLLGIVMIAVRRQ